MMAVNIANALAEKGIISHLCATRKEGGLKVKLGLKVRYLFINKKKSLDFNAIQKLVRYIKYNEINTIHAHATSYFTAFLVKLWLPKIHIIWHDHYGNSENLRARKKFPLVFISRTFKTVISVNNNLHHWAQQNLNAKHYKYLPNFASFNIEIPKSTKLKGVNEKRIVCLANLRPQKDHLNLLKAFKIVQGKHTDWTLHLVGLDFKDTYSEAIKSYIKQQNLNNHVFLYGSCADTKAILKQATIGVLGSNSEGLPVALLEYGLSKLPVVVTDVGECGTVVTNLESGMVVLPNNENKMAEGILFLIENDKQRKVFGENLYKNTVLNYGKNTYLTQLISIYHFE
ncbi:MAG: glycosyltransferase family 4 protein [Lutibacter sp.]|nr:glycosyltransferase family 4 protein [Lutibacter sp.]